MSKNIVIVDIDGTISKPGERLKYLQQDPKDWDSFYADCFDDEPIPEMVELVKNLSFGEGIDGLYEIIFCTGRRECVRDKTINWLYAHLDLYPMNDDELLMRKDGDLRPDAIVKPELIREAGIDFNDIAFVLEDRNSMVAEYRRLGLICLQPFNGDF
jgi:hypothetical protein